jgi:hypothetical protein
VWDSVSQKGVVWERNPFSDDFWKACVPGTFAYREDAETQSNRPFTPHLFHTGYRKLRIRHKRIEDNWSWWVHCSPQPSYWRFVAMRHSISWVARLTFSVNFQCKTKRGRACFENKLPCPASRSYLHNANLFI